MKQENEGFFFLMAAKATATSPNTSHVGLLTSRPLFGLVGFLKYFQATALELALMFVVYTSSVSVKSSGKSNLTEAIFFFSGKRAKDYRVQAAQVEGIKVGRV